MLQEVPFAVFKKLKASEIKELKSFIVTSDGEYLCTIVIPKNHYLKQIVEYRATVDNCCGGEEVFIEDKVLV